MSRWWIPAALKCEPMDCPCGRVRMWQSTRPSSALSQGTGPHALALTVSLARPQRTPGGVSALVVLSLEVGGRFGAQLADIRGALG